MRPPIEIDGNVFSVIDASEAGLRLRRISSRYPKRGTRVTGQIEFSDGDRVEVVGYVLRVTDQGDCVLVLDKGIPRKRMLAEQRRMIQKNRV